MKPYFHRKQSDANSLRNIARQGWTIHLLAIQQAFIPNPQHPDDWIHYNYNPDDWIHYNYNPDYNQQWHLCGRGCGERLEANPIMYQGSGREDIANNTGQGLADELNRNYNQGFI